MTDQASPIKPLILFGVPVFLLLLALVFVLAFDVRPVFGFGLCGLMGAHFFWNASRYNRRISDARSGGPVAGGRS